MKKRIIVDNEEKEIIHWITDNQQFVTKRFYGHNNMLVYNILEGVTHKNLVNIIKIKIHEDSFTVFEEYLGDITLEAMMQSFYPYDFFFIIDQICEGLECLHKHRIVHRDLKPSNIFFKNGLFVIDDFNISKLADNHFKQKDTQHLGSVGYASPEQYGFQITDKRSDIYALGVLMRNLLGCDNIVVSGNKVRFDYLVKRCTQLDPEARFQDIKSVKKELNRLKNGSNRFTLPGFRTRKLTKMVIAFLGYALILYWSINNHNPEEGIWYSIAFTMTLLSIVFAATNYAYLIDYLPTWLRKIPILRNFVLWFFMTITILLFCGILSI